MLVVICFVFQLSSTTFKVDKLIAFSIDFCNHGDIEMCLKCFPQFNFIWNTYNSIIYSYCQC